MLEREAQQKNSTAAFFVVCIGSMVQLRTPAALEIALYGSSFQPLAIFRQRLGVKRDSMVSGCKAAAAHYPHDVPPHFK
jgi:hypothetical protein